MCVFFIDVQLTVNRTFSTCSAELLVSWLAGSLKAGGILCSLSSAWVFHSLKWSIKQLGDNALLQSLDLQKAISIYLKKNSLNLSVFTNHFYLISGKTFQNLSSPIRHHLSFSHGVKFRRALGFCVFCQ